MCPFCSRPCIPSGPMDAMDASDGTDVVTRVVTDPRDGVDQRGCVEGRHARTQDRATRSVPGVRRSRFEREWHLGRAPDGLPRVLGPPPERASGVRIATALARRPCRSSAPRRCALSLPSKGGSHVRHRACRRATQTLVAKPSASTMSLVTHRSWQSARTTPALAQQAPGDAPAPLTDDRRVRQPRGYLQHRHLRKAGSPVGQRRTPFGDRYRAGGPRRRPSSPSWGRSTNRPLISFSMALTTVIPLLGNR